MLGITTDFQASDLLIPGIILALGFLLPPTVNLNHFRVQLSQSLSRSLGRQVSIQDVHLRLLPLPGFTFRQLKISDVEEFGAEPILQTAEDDGQHSVATLRLSSLWRGRFEIASISLTQASLNVVRAADGHWNLERLITRAAQVPSAPTSKKQAEARTRFPYIEVKESRINFKVGAEKKPFALSDSEFALWLAAENRWNVRLKAVPLRTDESVSDTGTIKLSGSFDRARQFSDTPFHLQVSWERPEVNAITRIARGHDPGWRGSVDLDADLKGTPADFRARLNASVDEFRRYDIARSSPFDLRFTCDHRFRAEAAKTNADVIVFCAIRRRCSRRPSCARCIRWASRLMYRYGSLLAKFHFHRSCVRCCMRRALYRMISPQMESSKVDGRSSALQVLP